MESLDPGVCRLADAVRLEDTHTSLPCLVRPELGPGHLQGDRSPCHRAGKQRSMRRATQSRVRRRDARGTPARVEMERWHSVG